MGVVLRMYDVEEGNREQRCDEDSSECEVGGSFCFAFEDKVVLREFELLLHTLPFDVDPHVLDVVKCLDVDNTVLILFGQYESIEGALRLALLLVDIVVKELYALQMFFRLDVSSDVVGVVEQLLRLVQLVLLDIDVGKRNERLECMPMV